MNFKRWVLALGLLHLFQGALANESVSVQLLWKHQFEFAAFYAAQSQGYYRDAGLNVTIREGGPGINATSEVTEGRSDFGVGASSLVVDRYNGHPVVALATLLQHSPITLLAKRTKHVNSVLDLAEKPIAVDPHSRDEIEAYLLSSGLKREQLRFVDQTDWDLTGLDKDRVAAQVVYLSNEPFLIRDKAHQYLLLTPRSAGIDLFGNMLFTSEAMLRNHPQVVEAFRNATLKGLVYALEHPETLTDLILAQYNTQGKSREHLLFEAEHLRELTRPDIVEPGYMSLGRWRHVVDVYAGQGKIPSGFDLGGFIYDSRPPTIPPWMMALLVGSAALLLLSWIIMARMQRLNHRLHQEIVERQEAEKALSASESQYRELVENANAVILRMSLDGTVAYFNEVAEKVFGFSAAEILGKHVVGTIVPPVETNSNRDLGELIRDLLARPECYVLNENENMTKDGRRIWVAWSNKVIVNDQGDAMAVLSIGHDVSQRHQLELEINQHQLQLEATVAQRTAELTVAKEAAETANQSKSAFLANMSHEIRTPLNAIIGMGQLVRRGGLTERQLLQMQTLETACNHLLEVIDSILQLSKIEAGKLEASRTAFSPREIIQRVAEMIEPVASAQHLEIRQQLFPVPDVVLGDATKIQQALLNLAANAVKFTNQGGVYLSLWAEAETDDAVTLRFSVKDTGIGIAPDDLPRLFTAFEQADNSNTRKYGGTGLGLSITQKFARLMGGDAGVESVQGQGSTFWFTVRVQRGTTQQQRPSTPQQAEMQLRETCAGSRILVVDDDEVNRAILCELLSDMCLVVESATDGVEAVDKVEKNAYDVILMDMQMPNMDGLEATQHIRKLTHGAKVPILALTANAFAEDKARCLEVGMNDFFTKPIVPAHLYDRMRYWIEHGKAVS